MKPLSALLFILLLISCQKEEEKKINCSVIDCIGGDIITIEFFLNNQNILEQDSLTNIRINQNLDSVYYVIDTFNDNVEIFLQKDAPLTIMVNRDTLQIDMITSYQVGECCSGISIEQLSIDGKILCKDKSCDDILQIDLNQ